MRIRRLLVVCVVCIGAFGTVGGTSPAPVFACSCAGTTDAEAHARAEAVFVGQLIEVRGPTVQVSSAAESRFIFAVERVYKGSVYARQSIVSASSSSSCGLGVQVGSRALVFGDRGDGEQTPDDGEFAASLCNGTRQSSLAQVPASFGTGSEPLAGSSPIGEDDSLPSELFRNWYWIVIAILAIPAGLLTIGRRNRRRRRGDASV